MDGTPSALGVIVQISGWVLLGLSVLHLIFQGIMRWIRTARRMDELVLQGKVYDRVFSPLLSWVPPVLIIFALVFSDGISLVLLLVSLVLLAIGSTCVAIDMVALRRLETAIDEEQQRVHGPVVITRVD